MNKVKELIKKYRIIDWIAAVLAILLGIMFILYNSGIYAVNADLVMFSIRFIDIFLGVMLILVGAVVLVYCFVSDKNLFSLKAFLGALLIGLGIYSIAADFSFGLISLAIGGEAFLLLAFGGVLLIDAVYDIVVGLTSKSSVKALAFVELLVSVLFITLGILVLAINALQGALFIIMGAVLILIAVIIILNIFLKLSSKVSGVKQSLMTDISFKEDSSDTSENKEGKPETKETVSEEKTAD